MLMNYQQACEWLEIDASVTLDESILKAAFRKAAIREHPDKSDHTEATHRFQCVQHAHQHLLKCVARHATGPTANYDMYHNHHDDQDDNDYYEEDDEDGEYFNPFEELFRAYFMHHGIHVHFGGPGSSGSGSGMAGHGPSRNDYYARQQRQRQEEEERRYEDYMEGLYRRTREREAKKMRKERQRQQELSERRQQAQREGRDCFEAWNIKALQLEATKRGLKNCKGMQQQSIVELLIDDETKKRLRRQLKEQAPLVEEWCQIVNLESQPEWNGKKVRAIDFFESK
jgi:DnaJ-class molecular chaperone